MVPRPSNNTLNTLYGSNASRLGRIELTIANKLRLLISTIPSKFLVAFFIIDAKEDTIRPLLFNSTTLSPTTFRGVESAPTKYRLGLVNSNLKSRDVVSVIMVTSEPVSNVKSTPRPFTST